MKMLMPELFNKKRLKQAIEYIKSHKKDSMFISGLAERKERIEFYQNKLSKKINKIDFEQVIKKLWAMRIWGNKDYVIDKMIKENGFDKIQKIFSNIALENGNVGMLYEELTEGLKFFGPSIATELLCHVHPYKAGIWNIKARTALTWLEAKGIPNQKYWLDGKEYEHFCHVLKDLAQIMTKELKIKTDLLTVDYFLWEITQAFKLENKHGSSMSVTTKSRHKELQEKIAAIGKFLGFEIELEKHIAQGATIDALWTGRIANLGTVNYVFEVQDKGAIDSLILNLQKALSNPTVQKLIVVTDSEQIKKIRKEIESMPEAFRKMLNFWDAIDVDKTYTNMEKVMDSISELNLFNDFE